jgi:hypothetical protein
MNCPRRDGLVCNVRLKNAKLGDSLVFFDGNPRVTHILNQAGIPLFSEQDPNAHLGRKRYYAPSGVLALAKAMQFGSFQHGPLDHREAIEAVRKFANEDVETIEALLRLGGAEAFTS